MTGFRYIGILSFFIYQIRQDQLRHRMMYIYEGMKAHNFRYYQDQGGNKDRNPGEFDTNMSYFVFWRLINLQVKFDSILCQITYSSITRIKESSQFRPEKSSFQGIPGKAWGVAAELWTAMAKIFDCNRIFLQSESIDQNSNFLLMFYLPKSVIVKVQKIDTRSNFKERLQWKS